MSLATVIADDVSDVILNTDDLAQSVTYAGSAVDAVVKYEEAFDEQRGSVVRRAEVLVATADVSSPAYRDAVVIGGDTWYVRRVLAGDAYMWKLECERDERPVM